MNSLEKYSQYCTEIQDQPSLSLGKNILLIIKRWHQKSVTRRHLRDLPDYLLDDIGIDKQLAKKEADKPFWE